MKNRRIAGLTACITTVLASGFTAFAAESSPVVEAITTAGEGLKTDAIVVIGAGVGVGVIFFAAKLLWGKFKSMAK